MERGERVTRASPNGMERNSELAYKKYTLSLPETINELVAPAVRYKWILRKRVHVAACRTSRAPVKNPRAACRGMSLESCRGMAITGFLESSFFLYLVLNRVSINNCCVYGS